MGQGADLLEKRWWDDRPDRGEFCLVFGVELLANGSDLTKLKFGEPETAPAFGGADGANISLRTGFSPRAVGNDLQPAALFNDETFKQIGRARCAAVGHRQPQMRNAGFEIVLEAGDRGWQRGCVFRTDAVGELRARSPVTEPGSRPPPAS